MDEVWNSSGINAVDHEMLKEQVIGDYETTKKNEIFGKSDLLNDLSFEHQNTIVQGLDSLEIIPESMNATLLCGVDISHPIVKKNESYGEPVSIESIVGENLNVEGGLDELEASKIGTPLQKIELLVEKCDTL
ncbi:hypothetical protein FXO38_34523 [Capsicum annuum]|uniref:Uncharacterized protein n=1 Tax=Capsicum annuum TaxID=4072 RepID=A0A2G2YWC5_CAPAN|nr:hypothetical protein FXO37_35726 [Capsicum annuum]KAF3616473.1 hypothetical protein FXO38_34523 [Capsicum annuum]PHT74052.1 hypothetical protein T459_21329 [Capsicum annuum]